MSELFTFQSPALPATSPVVRFTGHEAVNDLYGFDVRLLLPRQEVSSLLDRAIGERGTLTMLVDGDRGRVVHGIITAADVLERFDGERVVAAVHLAPKLARLTLKRASRVFIERTVREIVAEMLERDGIRHRFSLRKEPEKREMCVQYAETDHAFVTRLLAEEGMFTFFEHPTDGAKAEEMLVIGDEPAAYVTVLEPANLRFRRGAAEGGMVLDEDMITSFVSSRRLRPQAVLQRTFDPARPHIELGVARAVQGVPRLDGLGTMRALVDRDLTLAEHFGPREGGLVHPHDSTRSLEAERRGASDAGGETPSRRLLPGAIFTLTEHDVPELDRAYVITEAQHEGFSSTSHDRSQPVYTNRFRCEPADLAVRPARPAARVVQALETATVMGPPGQDVFTDDLGRIKLKFHWDLDDSANDKRSCWARVGQAWAGAGWGAQFIPRVGSEVLVGFMGGDPDRPVVLGGVYNGTNPIPFTSGSAGAISGIRSRSLAGTPGHEIILDDRAGEEVLAMRARGQMVQEVEQDLRVDANGSTMFRTAASRSDLVGGSRTVDVANDVERRTGGCERALVEKDRAVQVCGSSAEEIYGNATTLVGGGVIQRISGDRTTFIGVGAGDRGSETLAVAGGCQISSRAGMTLSSSEQLTLRVGSSSITLAPDRILIESDEVLVQAKKKVSLAQGDEAVAASLLLAGSASLGGGEVVAASGAGATLHLDADAKLDGALVKLNCGAGKGAGSALIKGDDKKAAAVVRLDPRFLEGTGPYTLVVQMPDGSVNEYPVQPGGEVAIEGRPGDTFMFVELRLGERPVAVRRKDKE